MSTYFGKGVLSRLKTHLDYWNPTKFVFESLPSSGSPISIASINHVLKESVKITGITKRMSAHSLRHSYATPLVESHVPLSNSTINDEKPRKNHWCFKSDIPLTSCQIK
ncbi:tyrosine-type recombinase/integrase [Arachidicoccus rhizosphaerae]|uniref:tyrosine-type recombinase/integrase n=1 Tax=Arachidicoccus rhizosphaerae TaxID=551991 RepID=UPI000B8833FD